MSMHPVWEGRDNGNECNEQAALSGSSAALQHWGHAISLAPMSQHQLLKGKQEIWELWGAPGRAALLLVASGRGLVPGALC